MQVVLASASPRRRELFKYLYPDYLAAAADVDETPPPGTSPERVGVLAAQKKALCVQKQYPEALVIGADTVVEVQGEVLGKPRDSADAVRMLRMLSGTEHRVYTGVSLRLGMRERCFTQCTHVWFYPLTDDEIAIYLKTKEWTDKAGAYGIQGYGCTLVERIEGDYFNVMGIPIARLAREAAALLAGGETTRVR